MNYSITRFTGIDYSNKSARWDLIKEVHSQESALAHCKSLNLNQPYYHRVEVSSRRCPELPRFVSILMTSRMRVFSICFFVFILNNEIGQVSKK